MPDFRGAVDLTPRDRLVMEQYQLQMADTVLSCPACWAWQLHYYDEVPVSWPGGVKAFEAEVESLLKEHVARDCPHPALFHTLAKAQGVV